VAIESATLKVVANPLQKIEPGASSLAPRRSDATDDEYVRAEMAKGEAIVLARKYTQTGTSCGLQLAAAGSLVGLVGTFALGSILAGAAFGGGTMVLLAALLLLETSNRIVVTDRSLVVQASVLTGRYELDRIDNARVETLGPLQWARLDVKLFDPWSFFKKTPGLRFRYRKSARKTVEVFLGVADAQEYLALIRR
jgi:hypothetical protein